MKTATRRALRDYALTIGVAIAIAVGIRNYVIEAYQIPSSAMKPTLLSGDTIFVKKWVLPQQKSDLKRGDVIIFSNQFATKTAPADFIKRVIGLPGDRIAIENGLLYLNGHLITHGPFDQHGCGSESLPIGNENKKSYSICKENPPLPNYGPEIVPHDSIFVLGDFRSTASKLNSPKDWGMIPMTSLKGKALLIWLSIEPRVSSDGILSRLPHFRLGRMLQKVN